MADFEKLEKFKKFEKMVKNRFSLFQTRISQKLEALLKNRTPVCIKRSFDHGEYDNLILGNTFIERV